jgi:hypothetical protein
MRPFSSSRIKSPASLEPLEDRRLCSRTPGIFISDAQVNEAVGSATVTVSLNRSSPKTVRVNFATIQNGSATSGDDFIAIAGTLVFKPRETIKFVTVLLTDDATVEPDETFSLKLTSARNAYIADARGLVTIVNDDPAQPPPVEPPFVYDYGGVYDPGYGYDAFPYPGEHY